MDDTTRLLQIAVAYLAYRPRTEAEVRRHLARKDASPEMVDAVVARLRDLHFLDDAAFASLWVENRQMFRTRGARLLNAELRQKGIEKDLAAQAVTDAVETEDEHAAAHRAAEKKAATLPVTDFMTFSRRLGGFLLRRGFPPDLSYEVVRELWRTRTGEPSPEQP